MIESIAGRKRFQTIFEFLLYTSMRCLNYNNGSPMDKNGEIHLLKEINKRYKNNEDVVFFDVGANVGHYSEAIYKIFGNKAVIHAFEPSKSTFQKLEETTKNIERIFINNIGLSDEEKSQTLYSIEEGSYLASVYNRRIDHYQIYLDQKEEVQLSTIDDYCENNHIDKIHFLKLDVEGHELSILHGAKDMLAEGRIEYIQFEFGGCNIDSRTYFQDFYYLLKDKYRLYRIVKDGIVEIKAYTECLEIFGLINFLAIKRD